MFPVLSQNATIVFIGDSITDGGRACTGNDYNHTMGQSYPFILSATLVARLAAKYHLPLIHYQQAFDAASLRAPADHWIWDGVHPHYAGHALMADE